MHCMICRHIMLSCSSQTVEDEKGSLLVTRWSCAGCGRCEEEIWISRHYQGARPRRLRYGVNAAVALTIPTRSRAGRGSVSHVSVG
jgi:hypothetical protein